MRWKPTNKRHVLLVDNKIQPKSTMLTFNIRVIEILKVKQEIHKMHNGMETNVTLSLVKVGFNIKDFAVVIRACHIQSLIYVQQIK